MGARLILLAVAAAAWGCTARAAPPSSPPAEAVSSVRALDFASRYYEIDGVWQLRGQLRNGIGDLDVCHLDGGCRSRRMRLRSVEYGDLTGDSAEEAAVRISSLDDPGLDFLFIFSLCDRGVCSIASLPASGVRSYEVTGGALIRSYADCRQAWTWETRDRSRCVPHAAAGAARTPPARCRRQCPPPGSAGPRVIQVCADQSAYVDETRVEDAAGLAAALPAGADRPTLIVDLHAGDERVLEVLEWLEAAGIEEVESSTRAGLGCECCEP